MSNSNVNDLLICEGGLCFCPITAIALESSLRKRETGCTDFFWMSNDNQFDEQIIALAKEHGFDLCGVVALGGSGDSEFEESERFEKWIAEGNHGEMQYLAAKNDS